MYSLTPLEEEIPSMATRRTQKGQAPIRGGVVERTFDEDLAFEERLEENPRFEVEVFAVNVLTEPLTDVASIKTPLLKRKVSKDEGLKRKPKKSKKAQSVVPVEGTEGPMIKTKLFDDIPDDDDMEADDEDSEAPEDGEGVWIG
ncbi:hypothetical protein LIER_11340 [Lithospermum erythrorhizon]|uniref:Uncharacterized protein n=1 Tax=Lithospermum erythrorhizon TaxID=34254 RepID=A0AAV3PP85_LITER